MFSKSLCSDFGNGDKPAHICKLSSTSFKAWDQIKQLYVCVYMYKNTNFISWNQKSAIGMITIAMLKSILVEVSGKYLLDILINSWKNHKIIVSSCHGKYVTLTFR